MVWILAALIAAQNAPEPETRAVPVRQAQATVRILSAVVVDVDGSRIVGSESTAQRRETKLRLGDGSTPPAKLLEFQ